MALGRVNEEIDPDALQVVGFIHDAIVCLVKCEYLDWGMRTIKRYMQTNPVQRWFGIDLKVPIVADVSFGLNLGEVHECEGFELDQPFDYTSLKDKEGNLLIEVPRQRTPPNNGLLSRSAYTTPDDLEDEDAPIQQFRRRLVVGRVSTDAIKRVERSQKQMVINRRNQALKNQLHRRARPTA
jgi:hypothetical protein